MLTFSILFPILLVAIILLAIIAWVLIFRMDRGTAGLSAIALRVLRAMPADETVSSRDLAKRSGTDPESVKLAMNELRTRGFVNISPLFSANGTVAGRGYLVTSAGSNVRR